jgi:prepilin-type processing-associated H-X9-DG protein
MQTANPKYGEQWWLQNYCGGVPHSGATGTYYTPGQLGVFAVHHATAMYEITDGTSCTFLAGEKSLYVEDYATGTDWGDDQMWDIGWDWDICRTVLTVAQVQGLLPGYTGSGNGFDVGIEQDTGAWLYFVFGSAHPVGANMAMCDGSVRMVNYSTDLTTLLYLGDMADGHKIDGKSF